MSEEFSLNGILISCICIYLLTSGRSFDFYCNHAVFAPLVPVIGYRAVLGLSGYLLNNIVFIFGSLYLYWWVLCYIESFLIIAFALFMWSDKLKQNINLVDVWLASPLFLCKSCCLASSGPLACVLLHVSTIFSCYDFSY